MSTVTATTYTRPAKALHAGLNQLVCKYASNIASGDTLKLFKVPHGAVIVDAWMAKEGAGGDITLQIRDYSASGSTTSSAGAVLLTQTASGVVRTALKNVLGFEVSVSDTTSQRYVDVEAVNASAISTGTHRFSVSFVLDAWG